MKKRKNFANKTKKAIFNSAKIFDFNDLQKRLDFQNKVIHYQHYNDEKSEYGWNIDHIDHDILNNNLENLRPVNLMTHKKLNEKFDKENKDKFLNFNFGTAGIRAKLGDGPKRLNKITIQLIAKSYIKYIKRKYKHKNIVNIFIGFDARESSREFKKIFISEFLKIKKINVYTFDDVIPTSYFSYLIKKDTNIDSGIFITASHNPKSYNGVKFYNNEGMQIEKKEEDQIQKIISSKIFLQEISNIKNNSSYHVYPNKLNEYFSEIHKTIGFNVDKSKEINITFLPLGGTSYSIIPKALDWSNVNLFMVKEKSYLSNNIENINVLDPINPLSFKKSIQNAKINNSDLIFLLDPDGDRVRFGYKRKNGSYEIVNMNNTALFICNFYKSELKHNFKEEFIVRSKVSTNVVKKIVGENISVFETNVGFKNLYKKIKDERHEHNTKNFMSFEESNGMLFSDDLGSEKDSIQVIYLLTSIFTYYNGLNIHLEDVFEEMNKKYGYLVSDVLHLGILLDENNNREKLISMFKEWNYKNTNLDISSDEFNLYFNEFNWIKSRKSGTENCYKFYLHFLGSSKSELVKKINYYKDTIKDVFNDVSKYPL